MQSICPFATAFHSPCWRFRQRSGGAHFAAGPSRTRSSSVKT